MNRLDKKQIFLGTILGIILSILTLILLTRNIQPLSAQQTQQKYTVFKSQNLGFKFVNLSGQYLPIFAQTPTTTSPGNQVATKEYVDSKGSGIPSGAYVLFLILTQDLVLFILAYGVKQEKRFGQPKLQCQLQDTVLMQQ
jgi:hypothetical protein